MMIKQKGQRQAVWEGRYMNQKFFDIPKEKQDRIINAALQVFSQNGYRHAGTDEVVRRAGISKGLLFHYFESKLGLYIFLYDYAVRYMLLELAGGTEKNEKDLFALIRLIEEAAFRACRQYPYLKARLKFFGELLAGRHINAKCEHEINDLISEAVSKESPSASDYEIRIARYNAFRALVQNHVAVQGSETKFRRSIRAAREKMDILNAFIAPALEVYFKNLGINPFEVKNG